MSREVQEAYNAGYRKGYLDGFNKLQDDRSTNKWFTIPEAPTTLLKDDFCAEIASLKDEVNLLEGRIRKLERAFYGD